MAKTPDFDDALPQCEGPKLQPFPQRGLKVTFNSLISDTQYVAGHTDTGGHAHVFAVSIGGKEYALKIFRFYDDEEDRAGVMYRRAIKPIPIDIIHAHSDSFYNECRAFGRINDAGQNGKVAVRCYGHMTLPAETEAHLAKSYRLEWNRLDEDDHKPVSQQQPLRPIVKDLVLNDVPLTQRLVNKMLRDLKKIRALGVYPMDVRKRNYRAGLLLDMSIAMTRPHYLFDIFPKWRVDDLMRHDLVDIEGLANDEGFRCIALRNEHYCAKLRRPSGKKIIYK